MTAAEKSEFNRKVFYLKMAFPDMPTAKYFSDKKAIKNFIVVGEDGKRIDLSSYDEILKVGNKVYNVQYNSAETNLKVAVKDYIGMEQVGLIGFCEAIEN